MDTNKLREQLKIDEGVKFEVYDDHLGYKTFGIGHLVVAGDEEYVCTYACMCVCMYVWMYVCKSSLQR